MALDQDVLKRSAIPPQLPPPPEIEGFLKKLKRKTSNISGSWNKRWFFVDPKRREFGYAKTKATEPQSTFWSHHYEQNSMFSLGGFVPPQ